VFGRQGRAEAEVDQIAQRQRAVQGNRRELRHRDPLRMPLTRTSNAVQRFQAVDAQRPKSALAKYILANLRPRLTPKVCVVVKVLFRTRAVD
jgi:hypothetical protein